MVTVTDYGLADFSPSKKVFTSEDISKLYNHVVHNNVVFTDIHVCTCVFVHVCMGRFSRFHTLNQVHNFVVNHPVPVPNVQP